MAGIEPRRDGLPEAADYRDTGCSLAPRCLECPLEVCRYDTPHGMVPLRNLSRNAAILDARAAGESAVAIAARLGVHRRTVWRVLATK